MRPRIRSIKPEALLDEELWDLEQETGAPVFRAFVGLWTQADREGRFEWRPRALKAAVLPYWDGDFSRVLDALATRGFVRKYTVGGRDFGHVVTFSKHQAINGKEPPSQLPAPPENNATSDTSTRDERVNDASATRPGTSRVERKGTEGNGREPNDANGSRVMEFMSSDLERLFSEARKSAGGGSYKFQRSDYDRAQKTVAWASESRPSDPAGICSESLARFLAAECVIDNVKWPFWKWASDPDGWLTSAPKSSRRSAQAPIATAEEHAAEAAALGTRFA